MKKHTNLPNEITGEYYEEEPSILALTITVIVVGTLMIIAAVILVAIADTILGAETVTNFIADLLGSLMN